MGKFSVRSWGLTVCVLAQLAIGASAQAQTQEQIDWCVNQPKRFAPDLVIGGCTAAIQSGKWSGKGLAWAFANRGIGYVTLQDFNRALADYTTALDLDPEYAIGCYNRGTAYFRMKDDDRAIADFNQAIRFRSDYAASPTAPCPTSARATASAPLPISGWPCSTATRKRPRICAGSAFRRRAGSVIAPTATSSRRKLAQSRC